MMHSNIIIMEELPDIKSLYQQKYLDTNIIITQNHSRQASLDLRIAERVQHLNQRLLVKVRPPKEPVPKQQKHQIHSCCQRGKLRGTSTSMCKRKVFQQDIYKSAQKIPVKCELVRQIMRLSQHEMTEFQSSLGGQKTLMNLFSNFFQKRHRAKQESRQQHNLDNFKPIQNLINTRYDKIMQPNKQNFRLNGHHVIQPKQIEQFYRRQKDLTPWLVNDGSQFS